MLEGTNESTNLSKESIERLDYSCKHIIANEDVIKSNSTLWNVHKDRMLSQLVILLNFNFAEIAKRFDKLCNIKSKKDEPVYNEKELRRHYCFLHAMRYLHKKVDSFYYEQLSLNN
jgi:hypothetical protein